jgi:hypothetical protein
MQQRGVMQGANVYKRDSKAVLVTLGTLTEWMNGRDYCARGLDTPYRLPRQRSV